MLKHSIVFYCVPQEAEFQFQVEESVRVRDYSGTILWALFAAWISQILSLVALFLAMPRLPVFFFSIMELGDSYKYMFILLEISWSWYAWVNGMLYMTSGITFLSSTNSWLTQIG